MPLLRASWLLAAPARASLLVQGAVFLAFPGPGEVGHSSRDENWGFPEMLCLSTFCGTQAFRPISLCSILRGVFLALCSVVEVKGLLVFHVSFMIRKQRKLNVVSLPVEYSL